MIIVSTVHVKGNLTGQHVFGLLQSKCHPASV